MTLPPLKLTTVLARPTSIPTPLCRACWHRQPCSCSVSYRKCRSRSVKNGSSCGAYRSSSPNRIGALSAMFWAGHFCRPSSTTKTRSAAMHGARRSAHCTRTPMHLCPLDLPRWRCEHHARATVLLAVKASARPRPARRCCGHETTPGSSRGLIFGSARANGKPPVRASWGAPQARHRCVLAGGGHLIEAVEHKEQ